MQTEITIRRTHLHHHRRMLIGRSLAAAIAGSIPVPALDNWLSSTILRNTLRKIAEHHKIDISPGALKAVADGPRKPPEWAQIAGSAILFRILTRSWRRIVLTYVAAQRARAAARFFCLGTLFDHYCARLHEGLGLTASSGETLHAIMQNAIDHTPGSLSAEPFRKGLSGLGRAALRTPFEILDFTSRGALRRFLSREKEEEAVAELTNALDAEMDPGAGVLAKTAALLEMELTTEGNPYLEKLIATFEKMWHNRTQPNAE